LNLNHLRATILPEVPENAEHGTRTKPFDGVAQDDSRNRNSARCSSNSYHAANAEPTETIARSRGAIGRREISAVFDLKPNYSSL
jgi:hypothetical protein